MIRGFRHKGLAKFFETGSKPGIQAQHAARLRLILGRLGAATSPNDMALPIRVASTQGQPTRPVGGLGQWKLEDYI